MAQQHICTENIKLCIIQRTSYSELLRCARCETRDGSVFSKDFSCGSSSFMKAPPRTTPAPLCETYAHMFMAGNHVEGGINWNPTGWRGIISRFLCNIYYVRTPSTVPAIEPSALTPCLVPTNPRLPHYSVFPFISCWKKTCSANRARVIANLSETFSS